MSDAFEIRHAADLLRRHQDETISREFERIPKAVLLTILDMAGVMRRRPDDLSAEANAYHNGMAALALEIITRAGFDSVSLLAAALTGSLEGEKHDRHPEPGPAVILDAAGDPAQSGAASVSALGPNSEY